jgi:hypothetical protein
MTTTISINWIIKQLLVQKIEGSLSDVVITANWSCLGSDGAFSSALTGCVSFAPPSGDFTPYDQLTEAQVLGWCWANGVDKASVEAGVEQQIVEQANAPVVSLPLPWSPVPVVAVDGSAIVSEAPVA